MKVTDQLPNASSNLLCGLLVVVLWGVCGLASPSRAQQLVPDVSQTSEVAISKSLSKDHGSGIPQKRAPEPAVYANDKGDSVIKALNEKARSRALSSALAPGLGQIQNGQFWKAPLVWGGLGLSVYFIINNNNRYQEFAKAYRLRTDGDSTTIDKFDPASNADNSPPFYTDAGLRDGRETFRRNRTVSIISTAAVYLANVIDAYVFAHLQDFDVSDDLSMDIRPPRIANIAQQPGFTAGITLKLKP